MLIIHPRAKTLKPSGHFQRTVETHIASSELLYSDNEGTCYSSRIVYTPTSPELGTNLGYAHPFCFYPGKSAWGAGRSSSPEPTPPPRRALAAHEHTFVEPLIPVQDCNGAAAGNQGGPRKVAGAV